MTGATLDLAGQRFGRLQVLGAAQVRGMPPEPTGWWQCRCICGGLLVTAGSNVRRGRPCHACQQAEEAAAAQQRFAARQVVGWRGTSWRP